MSVRYRNKIPTQHGELSHQRQALSHRPTMAELTCRLGRSGLDDDPPVFRIDDSREGVKVTRVAPLSASAGTSLSGSATMSWGTRKMGIPASRGEKTSATKSTKQEGVRLPDE